jgi:hypothetical protein
MFGRILTSVFRINFYFIMAKRSEASPGRKEEKKEQRLREVETRLRVGREGLRGASCSLIKNF